MAKFSDCLNREWLIRITLGRLPALRELGFDVAAVGRDTSQLGKLADPETLGRVLWALCEADAAAKGVTPESFADGFDGEAIEASVTALLGAIADFSQPRRIAEKVKTILPGALARQTEIQLGRIEALLGSNGPAGNSPASPESTRAN